MAFRVRYWSCTKLADKIRGTAKPYALGWKEWDEWHAEAKAAHPFRYWLAEVLLSFIQDLVNKPADIYGSIRAYYYNRWVRRTNACVADPEHIKVGQYCDTSDKILPCMFNELVLFVEHDLKGMCYFKTGDKTINTGVQYLEHQIQFLLDEGEDTSHDEEILALYKWWKEERPSRKDPNEIIPDKIIFDLPDGEREEMIKILEEARRIEDGYDREDEEMLIRLVKIRKHLWV